MNISSLLRVLALGAACLAALPVAAVPITYRISGVGSGHLGSQVFNDAAFVFTGIGDTGALVPIGDGVWVNPLASLLVEVSGHGSAQGIHALDFFVNNASSGVGFLDELEGDILDVLGAGIAVFDGASAFGPLSVDLDYLAPLATTAGEFQLDKGSSLIFTAQLTPSTVPAPASSWLAVSALLALGWVRLRRGRSASRAPAIDTDRWIS